jgi:hypothetical protein
VICAYVGVITAIITRMHGATHVNTNDFYLARRDGFSKAKFVCSITELLNMIVGQINCPVEVLDV